jgi:hypothetical protein
MNCTEAYREALIATSPPAVPPTPAQQDDPHPVAGSEADTQAAP